MITRSAETSRAPLWLWPSVSAVAAALAAVPLSLARPTGGWASVLWPGDVDSASTLLQIVATAVITEATLTFSLTVVALQLASQQFSPRLLREVARDPVSKAVLSVLAGTFGFTASTVRVLDAEQPVPALSVFLALVLGIASLCAGLVFIAHMTRVLRVDTMMLRVHDETRRAIEEFTRPADDPHTRSPDDLVLDESRGRRVSATGSGFVRVVELAPLLRTAREHDAVVLLRVRPGDHVVRQAPLATIWTSRPEAAEAVAAATRAAIVLGYERTLDQDVAFGLRQLQDIAVKAVSPAINDPVTAATALGHMADLLVRLTGRRLGAVLHADEDGVGRVVVPDRDLRYHLQLCCGQVRRFGRAEPTVLAAVLGMLRDVAVACRDDAQRAEVADAARLTAAELAQGIAPEDAAHVAEMHRRVELALAGDVDSAYADRAGETRSI